jgi:hypothetical protein
MNWSASRKIQNGAENQDGREYRVLLESMVSMVYASIYSFSITFYAFVSDTKRKTFKK